MRFLAARGQINFDSLSTVERKTAYKNVANITDGTALIAIEIAQLMAER